LFDCHVAIRISNQPCPLSPILLSLIMFLFSIILLHYRIHAEPSGRHQNSHARCVGETPAVTALPRLPRPQSLLGPPSLTALACSNPPAPTLPAVTLHTTACCSMPVVDITCAKYHSVNITSLRVIQQKNIAGLYFTHIILQATYVHHIGAPHGSREDNSVVLDESYLTYEL
jgi:hypothetical protein